MTRGVIIAMAVALVLAGCGDGDEEGVKPVETTASTGSSTTTTLSPEEQEKQKVREAIQEWDDLVSELRSDPDPNDPRIDDVLVPEAADALRSVLERNRERELVSRPADKNPINEFEVESIDLSTEPVIAMTCSRNNAVLTEAGEIVNDDVEAVGYMVEVTNAQGSYRVNKSTQVSYVSKPVGTPPSEVQCELS